jgi:DNA-binding winged helix-turn-helix (wHTH) protein/tetratricopeptide (TPR) repeat protein
MSSPPGSNDTTFAFRFDRFELRPRSRELFGDGVPIEVQGKVFDLIEYLVRHADRLVEKNEVLDAVWPRQVVTEAALSRCMMKARRALGDDAGNPQMIMTLHGRGFRFVAAVASIDAPSGPNPHDADEPPAPLDDIADPVAAGEAPASAPRVDAPPQRRVALLAALALVGLLAAGLWLYPDDVPSDASPASMQVIVLPVENETGVAEYDWVELGLMGAMTQALHGSPYLQVSSGTHAAAALPDGGRESPRDLLERLQADGQPTLLLATRLQRNGELLRLQSQLLDPTRPDRLRTFEGADPLGLAREVVQDTIAAVGISETSPRHRRPETLPRDSLAQEAYVRGLSLTFQGRHAEALPLLALAHETDPEAFWPALEYAVTLRNLDRMDEAEAILVRLIDSAVASGDLDSEKAARTSLGNLQRRQRRLDEARSNIERAVAISRELEQHAVLRLHLNALAQVAMMQHRYDEAAAHVAEAEAVMQREFPGKEDYGLLESRGIIALHGLQLDEAETVLRSAKTLGERQGNLTQTGWSNYYLAEAAWHGGRLPQALDTVGESVSAFDRGGLRNGLLRALRLQAMTAAQLGRFALAERAITGLRDHKASDAVLAEAEAWLAFERGDPDAADRWQALVAVEPDNASAVHEVSHEAARRQLMAIRVMLAAGRFGVATALARDGVALCPDDGTLERALFALAAALTRGAADVEIDVDGPPTWRGLAWELRSAAARRRGAETALPHPGDFIGYHALSWLLGDASAALLDENQRLAADGQLAALRGERTP